MIDTKRTRSDLRYVLSKMREGAAETEDVTTCMAYSNGIYALEDAERWLDEVAYLTETPLDMDALESDAILCLEGIDEDDLREDETPAGDRKPAGILLTS